MIKTPREPDISAGKLEKLATPTPAAMEKAESSTENAPHFPKPEKQSIGEVWWHRMTYGGVGYAANLILSIYLADEFISGRGRGVLKGIKDLAKKAMSGGMSEKSAEMIAEKASKYATFPLGGHFTAIPVKIMEDHARFITHRLNQLLDPNYQYKDLQASWSMSDTELPPLFDEPTRNTWGEAALRRGIGWAAVIGSGVATGKLGIDTRVEEATLRGANSLGIAKNPNGWAARWLKIGAMDSVFTLLTSVITATTKQTFGDKRDGVADDAMSIDIPEFTEHKTVALPAPEAPKTLAREDLKASKHRPGPRKAPEKHENHTDFAVSGNGAQPSLG